MLLTKRNKTAQLYDRSKIENSIAKVYSAIRKELPEWLFDQLFKTLKIREGISTRDIQTQIENFLMSVNEYDAARYFVIYRHINYHSKSMNDKVRFMREYLSSDNAATGSKFDPNANVTEKNLTTLTGELFKGDTIKLNRYRLHHRIEQMYGKELADEYIWLLENHFLYKHDESSIYPYCVSISLYPYLVNGLKQLGGLSAKPKNLDSFCGTFINLVFAVSAQFAGAISTPEFLMYFDYYARQDLGEEYTKDLDVFYVVGPKLRKLMDASGKWFRNIDALRNYNFASEELNKLKNQIVYDSERNLTSEELADWYAKFKSGKEEIVRLGDGTRTVKAFIIQKFQQIVYSLNQPAGARMYQSVFWNIGYFDKPYFEGIFGGFYFPDATTPCWESLSELQKIFMKWFNKERTHDILTFPVESFSLLVNKDTKEFLDPSTADFVAEMYSEGHSFFTYISDNPDALSSCCRLRNEMQDNEFSYTLGAGGVATGSKSVMTINLNRLVQHAVNKGRNYIDDLRTMIQKVHKFQLGFNSLIEDFKESGALPVYDAGFISMDKQYLTLGVNGAVEAAEFLGISPKPGREYEEFIQSILNVFYEENKKARTKHVRFNTEFVPAENLGVKFYKWDKRDGYKVPTGRNCYNSYFFASEDDSLTLLNKLDLHGEKFVKYLDGGSACHINLEVHPSKDQCMKILKAAAQKGTNYFTFNIPNTVCKDCGTIDKRYLKSCPHCGSTNLNYATRVIGYLKLIANYSKPRQDEAEKRYYIKQDEIN